jgi:NADH:ubiquinone oxidoreductase subunit 6 (subunit J)
MAASARFEAVRLFHNAGDLTRAIGQSLLTSYVLPFELLGVLFLAALVGALYFARPDD